MQQVLGVGELRANTSRSPKPYCGKYRSDKGTKKHKHTLEQLSKKNLEKTTYEFLMRNLFCGGMHYQPRIPLHK